VSRFSQLYIDKPSPLPDSERARRRLGKLAETVTIQSTTKALSEYLEQELGITVSIPYQHYWARFYEKCNIRDALDSITLTYRFLEKKGISAGARRWRQEARRIFAEEHLAFAIDDDGIVHPAVDSEFQRNRLATVAGLQQARYSNSLAAFERVSDELAGVPPNGKDAWRAVFTAVEGLFRLMFQSAPQLNAAAVEANLPNLIQQLHSADPVALRAANKQIASFKDWVDSSHNYRHEPGSEEPVQPPIDLAILAISGGAAFLRWLVTLDQASLARSGR
jgi:hypothetical protein